MTPKTIRRPAFRDSESYIEMAMDYILAASPFRLFVGTPKLSSVGAKSVTTLKAKAQ
jgi:hypothetical protein